MKASPPSLRSQLLTLAALLALLALTIVLARLPLGAFNAALAVAISACKALLVMVFFMRVGEGHPFLRVVAAAGFLWLSLLLVLALADYLTRTPLAGPW
ncbi:cytochrome C oxidase subunit IV family protein [Dyella jiangningensis]|uniref:Oxidase n=1 Tax=Dyella jiangningensis TaxID=1379159 RepID=A0A328P7C0_9GAMM|nr:cytochrome C oxidase subunit IV family protein [Dyella jiangningensis]RAO76184.1 hypothetical protein CA260_10825 [Dyella jiangningensis]